MTAEEQKVEYIKAVISAVEEDKKSVLLYVAFDLAVVSLTLSEKLLAGSPTNSLFVAGSLFLLLISAGLFFNHYRKIHLCTFGIVDTLLTLDTKRAGQIPAETWTKHKCGYISGYVVRLVGVAGLIGAYLAKS